MGANNLNPGVTLVIFVILTFTEDSVSVPLFKILSTRYEAVGPLAQLVPTKNLGPVPLLIVICELVIE